MPRSPLQQHKICQIMFSVDYIRCSSVDHPTLASCELFSIRIMYWALYILLSYELFIIRIMYWAHLMMDSIHIHDDTIHVFI
jgi:hypothetical protein